MALNCLTQKLEFFYIIPALRKEISLNLEKKGLKDSEIAKVLGITKSAISQYAHNKRASDVNFTGTIKKEIKKSSDIIFKKRTDEESKKQILKIIGLMKDSKSICRICKECNL